MLIPVYTNFEDIALKIKDGIAPTEQQKEHLLKWINYSLLHDEHIHIFSNIFSNLKKRIYSITQKNILFDLNDLDPTIFWELYQYSQLCMDNRERKSKLDEAELQQTKERESFNQKMYDQLKEHISTSNNSLDVGANPNPDSNYKLLRAQALGTATTTGSDETNRAIYSDAFRHNWRLDSGKREYFNRNSMTSNSNPSSNP
jgi:hypothetical protein